MRSIQQNGWIWNGWIKHTCPKTAVYKRGKAVRVRVKNGESLGVKDEVREVKERSEAGGDEIDKPEVRLK